jgi:hypothetical protein
VGAPTPFVVLILFVSTIEGCRVFVIQEESLLLLFFLFERTTTIEIPPE